MISIPKILNCVRKRIHFILEFTTWYIYSNACNTSLGITRPWQEETIGLTAVGVFYQFLHNKWQRNIESALRLGFANTYVEVDLVPKQGQLHMHNGLLTRYAKFRVAECRERFPRHKLQRKPRVSNPAMHHDAWRTCRHTCRDRQPTVAGKSFAAFPAHAQSSILRITGATCRATSQAYRLIGFPTYQGTMKIFDKFFDVNQSILVNKLSRCWWFETFQHPSDVTVLIHLAQHFKFPLTWIANSKNKRGHISWHNTYINAGHADKGILNGNR